MEGGRVKHPKAMVAGHICLDITPVFTGREVFAPGELLKPGKLIQVDRADVHTGGAVANTGLAMKRMGVDVCLMGKVGDDAFGKMVLSILEQEQAAGGMIVDPDIGTSYSIVLAMPGIDRIFLHHPGANDSFSAEDINVKRLENVDLFHLGYPPIMKRLYVNQGEELTAIFKRVHKMGIITSLDLAAVDPDSEAGKQDWEEILKGVLPYVDFFMPSIEELCFMIDRKRYEQMTKEAGHKDITEGLSISKDIKPLAQRAMDLGAGNLVLKCGAPGIYYHMGNEETFQRIHRKLGLDMKGWQGKTGFEKSYVPSRILSGTGAGDTTIAAFLTSLLYGYSLEECLQTAAAAGAGCVEHYDALGGILPVEEQQKRVRGGLKKQELIRE